VPLPLEDYALIGDTHTAALVGRDGSIDWLCLPRFDSGACFAALLGDEDNGRWLLAPVAGGTPSRRYLHDTLVLETTWEADEGAVRVLDFMPPREETPDLVRIVEGVRGSVRVRSELVIRFDYGHIVPWVRNIDGVRLAVAGVPLLQLEVVEDLRVAGELVDVDRCLQFERKLGNGLADVAVVMYDLRGGESLRLKMAGVERSALVDLQRRRHPVLKDIDQLLEKLWDAVG